MKSYRNTSDAEKIVGYCIHTPQHKRACPSPRNLQVPPGAVLTYDEAAPNGSLITAACDQAGMTPTGL